MATGEDWSIAEVEEAVAAYFAMLRLELEGKPFNKSERNELLRERLEGRSHGSVEFKHSNISAVLREMNLPFIRGYQPRGNYQQLLFEATYRFLESNPDLSKALAETDDHVVPSAESLTKAITDLVDEPPVRSIAGVVGEHLRERRYVGRKRDLALIDARRRALGEMGEDFVVWFERKRLESAGAPNLAKKVERVSVSEGDGLGYDVRSYEDDGRDRKIEVKTTTYGKFHPFLVSINEIEFSNDFASSFYLYRVFHFGSADRLFMLPGSLRDSCNLDPMLFRATF